MESHANSLVSRLVPMLTLMCQHYSGHTVTQLYAEFRTRRATNSDSQNEFFHDYKRPQSIQILTA